MSTSPIALWGLPGLPPIGPTVKSGTRTYPPRVAPLTPVRSSHRRSETNRKSPSTIGPVELLVVLGFDRPDFPGEIRAELEQLRRCRDGAARLGLGSQSVS